MNRDCNRENVMNSAMQWTHCKSGDFKQISPNNENEITTHNQFKLNIYNH